MTMTEIFEAHREKLARQLDTAATPDQARPVLEAFFDRMTYRYNENCADDRVREAAAGMLAAAKAMVPISDTVRDIRIWERSPKEGKRQGASRGMVLFLAFLIAGAALCAAAVLTTTVNLLKIPSALVLLAGAGVCFFLAGRFSAKTRTAVKERMTECIIDSDKMCRTIRTVMMIIDRNLDQIAVEDVWNQRAADRNAAKGMSAADLALYSGLLEASYSGDSAYAFEKLSELKYYLHTKHIDVVDYSEEHAAWFDRLPSEGGGTLRPALVCDGMLLKKGLASAARA